MKADEMALRNALVQRYEELYMTNAPFHAAVDQLVTLLPAWVEGLAVQAVEMQEETQAQIRAMARGITGEAVCATPGCGDRLSDHLRGEEGIHTGVCGVGACPCQKFCWR